ncbi:hypothetical protein HYALB_00010271 [Hymenoscyphus albidus]|uniref:Uncharacterized protein n=1 Tax=Hymenoscyphus albidus TaxID=595503 RepID=A0A9N9LQC4_9HELO|nr:hypothetical protein HYALB_00010271 [Hymenoscyphus albidus]
MSSAVSCSWMSTGVAMPSPLVLLMGGSNTGLNALFKNSIVLENSACSIILEEPTRSEEAESSVKVVLAVISQYRLPLVSHLFVCAQYNNQEPCITMLDLIRMPFSCGNLIYITFDAGSDSGACREATSSRKMDAGGKKGIDKATCITDDSGVR